MLPRLDAAMLAALTAPAPAADGGAGAALTGDARQAAFQRALQPLVGLAVPAEVMSAFSDGTFLVKVADNNVRMALPPEVQVGSQVALTVMSASPRPTFQLNTNNPQGGAPALVYSDAPPADGGAADMGQLYHAPLASQDAPVRLPPGARPAVPMPLPGGAAPAPGGQEAATAARPGAGAGLGTGAGLGAGAGPGAAAGTAAGGNAAAANPGGAARPAVGAAAGATIDGATDAVADGATPGATPRPSAGTATGASNPSTDAAPAKAPPSGAQPANTPPGNGKPAADAASGASGRNPPAASAAGATIAGPASANSANNAGNASAAGMPGAPTPGGQADAGASGGQATQAAGGAPDTAAPAGEPASRPGATPANPAPAGPRPGPTVMPATLAATAADPASTPLAGTAQRAGAAPAGDAGTAAEAPVAANGPASNPASLATNSAAAARMTLLNAAAVGVMVANNGLVRSQALAAALLGKAPLTPASELPDLDASTPAATLSSTARVLSTMLGTAQGTTGSATGLIGKTPLVAGGAPEPGQLAHKLQETVAQSGLFYESHVTDWVKGERTLPELMREPQMQRLAQGQEQAAAGARSGPDLAASQMVNQQLHTHEQARVQWQGEAWPGQPMQWDIRREQREGGQQQGGGEPDQPEQVWRSGVRFRFAMLGQISATVTLVGEQVHIQMQTDTDQSAQTLRAYADRLEQAMEAAGAPLSSLNITQQGAGAADDATMPGAPA